jgi:Protein of unknown function (DUF3800)
VAMLVFIDESGDSGFMVERGSAPIFVAAMTIFEDGAAARATEQVIRAAKERLRVRPEFKFNKSSRRVRDEFFHAVRDCRFIVRAIVVRKEVIYSPNLKTDKEAFYRFFIRQRMAHDGGMLAGARVVIDGSGDREFKRMLKASLRRQVGARLKEVRFAKSENDLLVQLADMCAGAIARSYRADRSDASRWRQLLGPRINDVWDFR